MGTQRLLIEDASFRGFFIGLYAQVHHQQRGAQPGVRDVVVVPERMHNFVGLRTVYVDRTAVQVLGVLVVGKQRMNLVAVAFVAQFEHIVRDGRHSPVVRADDALVVVGKGLSAHLGEKAEGEGVLSPGFIQVEVAIASLAPDAGVLGSNQHLQPAHLESQIQTGTSNDIVGLVLQVRVFFDEVYYTAVADFSLGKELQIGRQLLGENGRAPRQQNGQRQNLDYRGLHIHYFTQIYKLVAESLKE